MSKTEKIIKSDFLIGCMRLGDWGVQFGKAELQAFVEQCVELGCNEFDHADIYGDYTTEAEFGELLKDNSSLRQQITLTTKCGIKMVSPNRPEHKVKSYDSSKQHIIRSVEQSLKNLQTDYLDHILIHRPDFLMEVDEVLEAYTELKQAGKIRHFGVSNFNKNQLELLKDQIPLSTHQIEISLAHLAPLENGDLDVLYKSNIQPTAWSPLAGGQLVNSAGEKNKSLELVVAELGKKYALNHAQLQLAWLKRHPSGIIPVLGTSKIERVKEAMEAKSIKLEREDWYMLYSAAKGEKLP